MGIPENRAAEAIPEAHGALNGGDTHLSARRKASLFGPSSYFLGVVMIYTPIGLLLLRNFGAA